MGTTLLGRVQRGVAELARIHSMDERSMCLRDPCIRSALLRRIDLSSKGIHVQVTMGSVCCCRVLDRVDKVSVRDRCRLVRAVGRLTYVGRRFMGIRTTLRTMGKAKCKIIIPRLSRVAVRRPRIVHRKGGFKMGVQSGDPSVRVVQTKVRARVTPVINARRRTRSLVGCVERDPRQKRDV